MDRLIETLLSSGPWGILSAVLLVIIVALGMFVRELFGMLLKSQQARIDEGLKAHEITRDQINTIEKVSVIMNSMRDLLLSRRDR